MLQVYILKYNYELCDDVLQITRSYGKRERFIENIYLRQLVFMGKPEEAQKRWPNARKVRALHLKGENLTIALVYKASDGHRIALIQANDELKAELAARMKEK